MADRDESDRMTFSRRQLAGLAAGGAAMMAGGAPVMAQAPAPANAKPAIEPTRLVSAGETLRPEIVGNFGIVAAGRHYAVAAGTRILLAGGNATDAGVAAVFAAAVTEISHFGFGGEAPTIIHDAKTGKVSVISGQGFAPALPRRKSSLPPASFPAMVPMAAPSPRWWTRWRWPCNSTAR